MYNFVLRHAAPLIGGMAVVWALTAAAAHGGDRTMTKASAQHAVFAGGCFWCMEPAFERIDGVLDVRAGYTGGPADAARYETVSTGTTGHREAVEVLFDPSRVSYEDLVRVFFKSIDPTQTDGQFADKGFQYTTAVYYQNEEQKRIAEKVKEELARSGVFKKPIATRILPARPFYPAEEDHQDYHRKNPQRYMQYKILSGRAPFLEAVWSNPENQNRFPSSIEKISGAGRAPNNPAPTSRRRRWPVPTPHRINENIKTLDPLAYEVTQKNGTEPPFRNAYWNEHREGLYVDVVSGEPLFSSRDKFDSGTGWPSFTRPVEAENIVLKPDHSFGMKRIEVRSRLAGSHLGHVFEDGPPPTGLRFCINSAALRFIPKEELRRQGYGDYEDLFE